MSKEEETLDFEDTREDDEQQSVSGDTESNEGSEDQETEQEAEASEESQEEETEKPRRPPRSERRIKQLLARINEQERQIHELSKSYTEQLEALHTKVASTSNDDKLRENRLEELYKKRKAAFDQADSDEFNTIDREISKLEREALLSSIKGQAKAELPKPIPYKEQIIISDAEEDWVDKHDKWFDRPGYEVYTQSAVNLWNHLQSETQLSKEDPRLYAELDKRLSAIYPHLVSPRAATKTVAKSSVATGSKGVSSSKSTNNNKITDADIAAIKRYNFGDPNDPKVRKEWLENKR